MKPDQHTISEQFIDVGDGHQIYAQEWGNPKAKMPILSLHGGPGSSSKDKFKQLFDPEHQRVVFHDQRGAGRSIPTGSLKNNTTQDLIDDIEKIASKFNLEKFIITGGSWGSCLALAYALKHPRRVEAMVLKGIFTGSQAEIDWLDQGEFRDFFPDVWDLYLANTPKAHHKNPSAYHIKRILSDDFEAAKKSSYVYSNLEGALLNLDDRHIPEDFNEYDPAGTRIEIHYLANRCFMPDRYILDNAHRLTMPVHLIQGRYDAVCPPRTAYDLHHKLPNSRLTWTLSGHRDEREAWSVSRAYLLELSGARE